MNGPRSADPGQSRGGLDFGPPTGNAGLGPQGQKGRKSSFCLTLRSQAKAAKRPKCSKTAQNTDVGRSGLTSKVKPISCKNAKSRE